MKMCRFCKAKVEKFERCQGRTFSTAGEVYSVGVGCRRPELTQACLAEVCPTCIRSLGELHRHTRGNCGRDHLRLCPDCQRAQGFAIPPADPRKIEVAAAFAEGW